MGKLKKENFNRSCDLSFRQRICKTLALETSLGRTLTIFLTCLLVGSIAANILSLLRSWERTVKDAESEAINLSISQARQAEDTFLQTDLALQQIRRTVGNDTPNERYNYLLTDLKDRLPQLHGLSIFDAQGNRRSTSFNYVPPDINYSDREYFNYHQRNKQTGIHIGRLIRSRVTGEWIIPVSMRLNDPDGAFSGLILATIKLDYFKKFYDYFEMGDRDLLALLLLDGTALYVRPYTDAVINRNFSYSPLFKRELVRVDQGSSTWLSAIDGIVRVYGFARIASYPLVVVAGFDRAELRRHWVEANLIDWLINALLLIGLLVMGRVLFRQVRINIDDQLEMFHLRDDLVKINHTLQTMAMVDGLTGLANRRKFDATLQQALADSALTQKPVSLILLDIDYFKRYNDACGHVAGDACLRITGNVLEMAARRSDDVVARYGGEEFAIILPNTSAEDAYRVAWRAVRMVSDKKIPHPATENAEPIVTISAGCYCVTGSGAEQDVATLIHGADRALYQSKKQGRNRASYASETDDEGG